jgi:D-aminopeptidase
MKNLLLLIFLLPSIVCAQKNRVRDLGIEVGVMRTGELNAITDVPGVQVGHSTLIEGEHIRTGVTAILAHKDNLFLQKVPAAIYVGNGFGKLAGSTQVQELGNIETPIILTNTLSVGTAISATVEYMLGLEGMENVGSVNAVVGETNDGGLNDIRGMHVKKEHVWEAITNAKTGEVEEGNVGAGTGTVAFGWKGGMGTSSRVLPKSAGGYTVGVIVQSNFGGVLQVNGVPVDKEMNRHMLRNAYESADGSCMIVVMTDAPVNERNLERMAKRAIMGLAKTGGIASNGSGDYVIAASTAAELRIAHNSRESLNSPASFLRNDNMTLLFMATIEATEEAILNSLFMAEDMTGRGGRTVKALPISEVMEIYKKYQPEK